MEKVRKILFVCVENAGRSQMAEAFFKKYAPSNYQVTSAGTNPSEHLNPVVVEAMEEMGINLDKKPQSLSEQMISDSLKAINMGCMDKESCPGLFLRDIDDWNIPDPKGKSIEEVREIRDFIESKVKELVHSLEEN